MSLSKDGDRRRDGLFANLKGLLATLLDTGRSRLKLLATEAEEEKLRIIDLLVSAAAAFFLLSLGVVLLIICFTVAYWEQRLLVLGVSTGATLFFGFIFAFHLRSRLNRPANLFRASIRELGKDIEALRNAQDRT